MNASISHLHSRQALAKPPVCQICWRAPSHTRSGHRLSSESQSFSRSHSERLSPCYSDRGATPSADLEPKAGRAAVDRSDTIKVHMLSILEESDQIKLSNVPKELQDLVDELQSVPEDQRKKLEPHGIAGEWVSRVQTTDLISKDGKVDLGTLSFKQWKPNDLQVTCMGSFWAHMSGQVKGCPNDRVPMPYLQLKVDDHVGGVQIGVESDDHYQIDTSFTIEEGPLKGQRAISSALGRYEIDAENPARQTIFFTGLRLRPAPGTEGEALKKWVDVMQPENEGMDNKGVKEVTFPQAAKGFRDFLFYDRSIQVSVGNRGSLTILVPQQS